MRLLRWPLTTALDIGRAGRFITAATDEPRIDRRETRASCPLQDRGRMQLSAAWVFP
ncbi:hypothetical protein C7450_11358 [Chelatococcus asaccharovorans]|uniref:Uncharacterized protein n=1 Tax=Chelatococcus asaccharovorans TaxID=28210 RepID=A0A2V3TY24_9HYPH|nr:hypothetical protein C7450_11358 [Chelatococcus asaccharovorans]